jgi:hypothetical protein
MLGASPNTPVAEEARLAGLAWERLPEPRPQLTLEFHLSTGQEQIYYLGPHAPRLTPNEIDLLHSIWLEVSEELAPAEVHHHDVVHFALEALRDDLHAAKRRNVIEGLGRHLRSIRSSRLQAHKLTADDASPAPVGSTQHPRSGHYFSRS